ncbi:hypothetical protein [Micromonospora sp. DT229]|uniref:hypothetical protein n=1 Tax=Micromonospora sp. DT229 TaxID=3393430 RepID=UPI003CF42BA5
MLRTASPVTVALGLLGATVAVAGAVLAAPVPQPASAASAVAVTGRAAAPSTVLPAALGSPLAKAGKKQCTVTDPRLREMSGLVVTRNGYIVINDSTDQADRKRVFYLNKDCQVVRDVGFSGAGPFDTEDLALSPDKKKLWIADTGDNVTSRQRRERVAVWSMPVNGSEQPKLHRLAYPDGKPRDAEALLIGDDNLPLIITKVTAGKAEIFAPDGALKTGDTEPVPMKKLGDITLPKTDTENPLSTFGRVAITGAARSPDGSRVVLRTYADAFEYDVQNGDIVGALTNGSPRVTALADPFGEAISYSTDGKTFLTVSDAGHLDDDEPVDILSYTPSTEGPKNLAEDPDAAKKSTGQSFLDGLTLDDITYLIASVGVLGALLVGAGIFGILRARKRRPPAGKGGDRDDGGPGPTGGSDDGTPKDRARSGAVYGGGGSAAGVYGGGSPDGERPGVARSGPVYGGRTGGNGARPGGGGVYGGGGRAGEAGPGNGGRPGGGVYGGGARSGGPPPAGGRAEPPRGGARVEPPRGGGRAEPPRGGGRAEPPRGDARAEPPRGGGRAEPPRRGGGPAENDYRGRRSGRYREDNSEPYGQPPGGTYGYRGDRY